MKRKILRTLVVLVLTLGLVMAGPAAVIGQGSSNYAGYQFGLGHANDTAEWSTAKAAPETGAMGAYSVMLEKSANAGTTYIEFIPVPGTTVSDLATIGDTNFWYWLDYGVSGGPGIELQFTMPDYDSGTGYGHVDVSVQAGAYGANNPSGVLLQSQWANENTIINDTAFYYGWDPVDGTDFFYDNTGGAPGVRKTLADMLALIDAETDMTAHEGASAADWELTRVRIELYGATARTCYIDDITIDGTTYALEPFAAFDDHYRTGETISVAVYNGNANSDPMAIQEIGVIVTSTTDTVGDNVTLTETGSNTGVFTGSVTLVGAPPANRTNDEIVVSDTDTVTITLTADWGSGSQALVPTTTVDDSGPVILIVSPTVSENITDVAPEIKATYTDVGSGTDNATTVMTLNDLVVDATATTSQVTYTPSVNLTDGSYDVTVGISDVAGNPAVTASWSFTVDTVDPVIIGLVATPGTVKPNIENTIVFTATVTDGAEGSGIDTVTIDLSDSAIGGSDSKAMLDDGNAPDATPGDGTYTANFTGTITTEATYLLLVTATDYVDLTGTANITLIVAEDTEAPDITSPVITYPFVGVDSAMPGASVTISANVTDNVGVTSVEATSTALTGTVTLLDGGVLPDVTVGDHIYTGTGTVAGVASGNYTVTITAKDVKLNAATDVSLILTVEHAVGGCKVFLAEGWNLISLPLIPDDADITAVISVDTLASANVSSVGIIRAYDPATGGFPRYVPATGGDLTEMEDGCGYWVFMETADNLTITGRQWPMPPAVPPTYDVVVGWNLIGFKSLVPMIDYDIGPPEVGYLFNIAGTYPVVWRYDAVVGRYSNVKDVAEGMLVGHGFWLWVTEVGTIVPPQ